MSKTNYELAQENGFTGTVQEYLASLRGESGRSAYAAWLAAGNVGTEAQFLASLKGSEGRSAFQVWQAQPGNAGKTEPEYLAAQRGAQGASAFEVWRAQAGNAGKTEADYLASLKGTDGKSVINRGAWAPNTAYKQGEIVSFGGKLYSANADFVSGATFNPANWTLSVDSVTGAQGPSAFQVWQAQAGNAGKTEAEYLASLKGAKGDAPFILTGIDSPAVRPGNFAVRLPGAAGLTEMTPSPADMRYTVETQLFKGLDGTHYEPGAVVPYPVGGLTPGHFIVSAWRQSVTGPNWRAVPLPLPADLRATHTRVSNVLGEVLTPTSFRYFLPRPPRWPGRDPTNPAIFDDLSSYVVNDDTALYAKYAVPAVALARPLRVGSPDAAYSLSRFMRVDCGGTAGLHVVVHQESEAIDDEIEVVIENDSGGQSLIDLYGRYSGVPANPGDPAATPPVPATPSTQMAVVMRLTLGNDTVRFGTIVNGVYSTVTNAAGQNLTIPFVLNQGSIYRATFRWDGPRLLGKIRVEGQPDPGWTLEGWQYAVLGSGKSGVGADIGYIKVGQWGIAQGSGPAPTAPVV